MVTFRLMAAALICLPALAGSAARHYSYSGNDSSQWTSSVLTLPPITFPADFTVFPCNAASCAVAQAITDAGGNTYVVGNRYFPAPGASGTYQLSDVFIAKLNPAGATVFLATLSGKGSDQGHAIALDPSGNIIAGGSTSSPNFPLRHAIQAQRSDTTTGFLVKLNPEGSQLVYSTYFGGTAGQSSVNALAVDADGNVWATGETGSRDFARTPGMPNGEVTGMTPGGIVGAFVTKLAPAGDRILASGAISGSRVVCSGGSSCFLRIRSTAGSAIALDAAGNAYVSGNTNVTDLPATAGALVREGIGAWVARIAASGTQLDYLTYIGAGTYVSASDLYADTFVRALAVDSEGYAYLAGATSDSGFPATPDAFQTAFHGPDQQPGATIPPPDGFVAKLNPQGTSMVYATFLGGAGDDAVNRIAVDPAGAAYISGTTNSADFPVTTEASLRGDFIAVLNPAGSALSYSSRYPGGSVSGALALDTDGRLRVASPTGIVSALTLNAEPATRVLGVTSAAGGQLGPWAAPGEVVSLFGMKLGPSEGAAGQADAAGKIPTLLAGTRVLFDGVAAPLLYVSADQINAVAPFALSPGAVTTVRVVAEGITSPDFQTVVIGSRPAIFSGAGGAVAVNQDGSINSEENPAERDSVVAIWVTGVGPIFSILEDGLVATGAHDYECCKVDIYDHRADVLYAGAAPGLVAGIFQVNFRVTSSLPIGEVQQVPIRLIAAPAGVDASSAPYAAWIYVR